MTGSFVCGSNSVDEASVSPSTLRAYSMTMHCSPRQRPSTGSPVVRACDSAPSLPSMPRMPKPPGTQIASTPASCAAAPSGVSQASDGIHRTSTRASWAMPPCRSASVTDRYASGRSMYLPTSPTVTVRDGWWTRVSSVSQSDQSTSWNGRSSRRIAYTSRPPSWSTRGMS